MTSQRKDDVSNVKTIVDWIKAFEGVSSTWKVILTLALCLIVLLSLGGRTDINRSRVMGAGKLLLGKDDAFVPPTYRDMIQTSQEAMECAPEQPLDELSQMLSFLGMSEYQTAFQTRGLTLQTLERVWSNSAKWSKLLSLVIEDEGQSSALRFAVFLVSSRPGSVAMENLSNRLRFLSSHGIDSLAACAGASDAVMKPLVEAMQKLGLEEQGEYARILAECTS